MKNLNVKNSEEESLDEEALAFRDGSRMWVEVVPHGLVGGMIPNLCLMVFKEKMGSNRFAVSLPPLQGKITLNQSLNKEEPFRFISELFSAMKVRIDNCYFLQNKKGHVTVRVGVSGHPDVCSIDLTASDVIPFAVYSGCQFFCTKKFINEMMDQTIESPSHKKIAIRKPNYLN